MQSTSFHDENVFFIKRYIYVLHNVTLDRSHQYVIELNAEFMSLPLDIHAHFSQNTPF